VILAAVAVAAVAACNGSVSGPSGGGAQISGRVTNVAAAGSPASVSSLTALTTGTPTVASNGSSTLKVTINGTNISSEIDGGGRFELNGVPPGTVEMTFSGDGVSATLRLSGIEEGDHIEIEVRLDGNRVMVDSERRDRDDDDDEDEDDNEGDNEDEDDGELEVRGAVAGLTGTCPALTFTLGERTVTTSANTQFKDMSCSRVQNGTRVEVEGRSGGNGTIVALEVELD
jgi:hypothetical protein